MTTNHCYIIFITRLFQGVNCSQKLYGKHSFPNLANSRASQFMFPKYLIEYRAVKIDSEIEI